MSEVSCRTCAPFVDELKERGIPLAEAVKGLPIEPETLLKSSNRMTWNEFNAVL